MTIMTS